MYSCSSKIFFYCRREEKKTRHFENGDQDSIIFVVKCVIMPEKQYTSYTNIELSSENMSHYTHIIEQ